MADILPPPPLLTKTRDQRPPKRPQKQGLGPGPQPLLGLSTPPQPGSPLGEQEMGVRELGCSSHPLWEGLGAPLRRCQQNCHPAAGASTGISLADSPWPGCASAEAGAVWEGV